jgi:hypothetical protein
MAELDTKKREKLRSSQFAYVDSEGGEHLPINDESHRAQRHGPMEPDRIRERDRQGARAREKIVTAAKRYGIEVDEESHVAKPARSLRAANTKKGPRGGRRD